MKSTPTGLCVCFHSACVKINLKTATSRTGDGGGETTFLEISNHLGPNHPPRSPRQSGRRHNSQVRWVGSRKLHETEVKSNFSVCWLASRALSWPRAITQNARKTKHLKAFSLLFPQPPSPSPFVLDQTIPSWEFFWRKVPFFNVQRPCLNTLSQESQWFDLEGERRERKKEDSVLTTLEGAQRQITRIRRDVFLSLTVPGKLRKTTAKKFKSSNKAPLVGGVLLNHDERDPSVSS